MVIYYLGNGYQMRWDEDQQDWIYEPIPLPKYKITTHYNTELNEDE